MTIETTYILQISVIILISIIIGYWIATFNSVKLKEKITSLNKLLSKERTRYIDHCVELERTKERLKLLNSEINSLKEENITFRQELSK